MLTNNVRFDVIKKSDLSTQCSSIFLLILFLLTSYNGNRCQFFLLCCTIMHGLLFKSFVINNSGLHCTSELEPCIILQLSTKIEIYFLIHVYACANRVYCTVISTIHLYLYSILKPNKSLRLLDNFLSFISINNIIIYMVKQAI